MRGRGIDTPRLQIFFPPNFSSNAWSLQSLSVQCQAWSCGVVVITSALHAEGPQFDPGRDQILLSRLFLGPNCKYQGWYWIVFIISKLWYILPSCVTLSLPCHIPNSIDVSARHYPAVLSHTHMERGCLYCANINWDRVSCLKRNIFMQDTPMGKFQRKKCLPLLLLPVSVNGPSEFVWHNIKSSIV